MYYFDQISEPVSTYFQLKLKKLIVDSKPKTADRQKQVDLILDRRQMLH